MIQFTFQEQVVLRQGKIFMGFTSKNIFGEPTYAYVVTDKQTLDELNLRINKSPYLNYSECGDLITYGQGEPDDYTLKAALELAKSKYA